MRNLATFVLLYAVWMLWSGHTEPLLLELGAASCALVVWLSSRMGLIDEESYPIQLIPRLMAYVPWVLWQVLKTNVQVAKIILSPKMPISPHLVRVPVRQRTQLGLVIHANTVTITPGTVTLDVRDGQFLIHALTDDTVCADGCGELDRRVARLEGQDISLFPPTLKRRSAAKP